jgi:CRP-like cAMP-binding protein
MEDVVRLESQVEALSSAPLFAGLPLAKVRLLACMSEQMTFKAGDYVFRSGERADAVYMIVKGEVEFLVGAPEQPHRLIALGPGETFGEVSILADEDRTSSARAISDLTVIRLAGDCFFRLLKDNGTMALTVAKNLAKRLSRAAVATEELVH